MINELQVLVEQVLDNRLSKYRLNCPENIKDLFFLAIENDDELLGKYNYLVSNSEKGDVNRALGKAIKKYWGLQNLGRNYKTISNLIESFEKHSNWEQ